MNTNKTYKTLAGAYTAVEKAGAERFDLTYNGGIVLDILARTYKHAIKVTLAKWNLVRLDKTLYALESATTPDCKTTFKWTAVATFDSDGLPYAVGTPKHEEAQTEDKKPQPRKPTQAKGKAINFDSFKGTNSEKNKALHAELVSRGLKDSRTDEYKAIWSARPWAKA